MPARKSQTPEASTIDVKKIERRGSIFDQSQYNPAAQLIGGIRGAVALDSSQIIDEFLCQLYDSVPWPPGVNLNYIAILYMEHPDVFIAVKKIVDRVVCKWRCAKDPNSRDQPTDETLGEATAWLKGLFQDYTFDMELKRALTDFILLGNGAMEVARNLNDEVVGIYYAPVREIRVRLFNDGYVQMTPGGRYQRFNKYEPDETRRSEKRKNDLWLRQIKVGAETPSQINDGSMPFASEMIWWTSPNPVSRYYGLPAGFVLGRDVLLDNSAKQSNLAFFNNGLMPDYALLVEGGSISDDGIEAIKDYLLSAHAGPSMHHGILYISAAPAFQGAAVKVTLMPLQPPHKDMNFGELHQTSRDTILRAFGMAPGKGGVPSQGALGGGTAAHQEDSDFKNEVVEPAQSMIEHTYTRLLQMDGGFKGVCFEFEELDMTEARQRVETASRAVGGAAVWSINEGRRFTGQPAKTETKYDDIPEAAMGNAQRDPNQETRAPGDAATNQDAGKNEGAAP